MNRQNATPEQTRIDELEAQLRRTEIERDEARAAVARVAELASRDEDGACVEECGWCEWRCEQQGLKLLLYPKTVREALRGSAA